MPRPRKHRAQAAFLVAIRSAAGVVKMQMGQDHPIDLVRRDADGGEISRQRRTLFEMVALPMLGRRFAAVAGVDQSQRIGVRTRTQFVSS